MISYLDTISAANAILACVNFYYIITMYRNLSAHKIKASDVTQDHIISDLKKLNENLLKVRNVSTNQSRLILKIFQILKESIEDELSQEEVLEIIKGLNLPLPKDKLKRSQDDQPK